MKILIVAATAGLMALAACTPTTTNNTTVMENVTFEEANTAMYGNDTAMPMDNSMSSEMPATETNSGAMMDSSDNMSAGNTM